MEEVEGRQVWLPVKVAIRPPQDKFTPSPVIYKPSRRGIHPNVVHKITRSEGKCYEFAFVRSFSRFDANKYVCSACRVLRMQNPQVFQNHRLPYVRVAEDCFQSNPEFPPNADHFCRPKALVDVIHSGEMTALRHSILETGEEGSEEIAAESFDFVPLPPSEDRSSDSRHPTLAEVFGEHNYASTSRAPTRGSWESNYSNAASQNKFPQFSNEPVIRLPSIGASKVIYLLPYAREHCYEWFERNSRSIYFNVYACAGCNKMKENLGSAVGPVPTVHVRGDHYMTDPMRPRHRHYCVPKITNEQIVQGEMLRLMKIEKSAAPITSFLELLDAVRSRLLGDEKKGEYALMNEYLNSLAVDKKKVTAIERRFDIGRTEASIATPIPTPKPKRRRRDDDEPLTLAQKEAREKKDREKMEEEERRRMLLGEEYVTKFPQTPFLVETAVDPPAASLPPATIQPMKISPPEDDRKPSPTNAPSAVAFGLQKRIVVSKWAPSPTTSSDEQKKRPRSIPVLFPVKLLKMDDAQPSPTQELKLNAPPLLTHKDEDFVDVEGC